MKIRGVLLVSFLLFVTFLVAGCFQGEQTLEEIDVPEEVIFEDEENEADLDEQQDELEDELDESEATVAREIYLIDADGLVVPQELNLPKTESAALTTLEYMVQDGPVTPMLPNGFQAVLPVDTEVLGMNLQEDGTLIIDLSEEFTQYKAEEEVKILEAMTNTMTQFDKVERIKLWVNGEELEEMPVKGTPISSGYSPKQGINVFVDGKPNIQASKAVTVFYPKQNQDQIYYVPVTQYFSNDDQLYEKIIEAVMGAPIFGVEATKVFNEAANLVEQPELKEGVLQLVFNEDILKDKEEAVIADEVMETLVKSLTSLEDVEAVELKVEDQARVVNEEGKVYDRPVTIQELQNKEKM